MACKEVWQGGQHPFLSATPPGQPRLGRRAVWTPAGTLALAETALITLRMFTRDESPVGTLSHWQQTPAGPQRAARGPRWAGLPVCSALSSSRVREISRGGSELAGLNRNGTGEQNK